MKNSLKGYKLIATKSLWEWIKIGGSGLAFSLICIIIGIWLLAVDNVPEHTGFKFYYIFMDKPWATFLIIFSIVFAIIYIYLANQSALKAMILNVWNNKLSEFMIPRVHDYIQSISDNKPDWMNELSNTKFVCMLKDLIRQDGTLNKVQRLVMDYGVKGMKINKADFQQPEYQISHIVVEKIEQKLAQVSELPLTAFFVVLILHLILLILSMIFT